MASAIRVRTDDGRGTMLACPSCMYFATPGSTCPVCGEGIDYEVDDEPDEWLRGDARTEEEESYG